MKTQQKMKRSLNLILAAGVFAFASCSTGTDNKAETTAAHESSNVTDTVSAKPQFEDPKTEAVYEHYLHLSNALIQSNGEEAQSGAVALQTALSEAGSDKGADLAGRVASIKGLDAQRAELEELTKVVEALVKAGKLTSGVIYKQYCPMAGNNKGAYWLSSEKDIKNPYFGEEMLNCGETKEEIGIRD
ncbi:DUF3347 domain-containing protein [Flavihumibacter sp. R14]|nr:DUF3347 domain-containing protein [Flavihumibacter soli]